MASGRRYESGSGSSRRPAGSARAAEPGSHAASAAEADDSAGTYVTVRVNQFLSSDKNQAGDAFSATLVRPIVVDGVVVADRGQTLGGRVTEAKKAGRVEGTSRLGITLTDLPVVDGQQIPVQTQLVERNGSTSVGPRCGGDRHDDRCWRGDRRCGRWRNWRGHWRRRRSGGEHRRRVADARQPDHPASRTVLTFKIEQPVAISTDHAPYAFRYVDPSDYQQAGPARYQAGGPGYPPPGWPVRATDRVMPRMGRATIRVRLRLRLRLSVLTVLVSASAYSSGRDSDSGAASADAAKASFRTHARRCAMRAGFHNHSYCADTKGREKSRPFNFCVQTAVSAAQV